ncbi:TonB-dependent receptor [Halosquirtibacter xylanolyticus]|uniref:outer membrane beta-barrel family protein n=1 Tax=Halosquirtibacter xylanolyticus TaxID=3374599 RepID=UPI00374A4F98|nr:TonB-dependent receptor [Prolixibacteraceae bacterium]
MTPCLIQVSCVGFRRQVLEVNPGERRDVGTIILKGLELQEVVVSVRRPKVKQQAGKSVISVANTSLSDLGNSMDVLKRTPGVLVDNKNNITIFGKGTPLIIIDGREVTSKEELQVLESSNIQDIEIDKNPSATTDASASSIVRITTKRKDQFSAKLSNTSYWGRHWSNVSGLYLTKPFKHVRTYFGYYYFKNKETYYNDDYTNNYQSDYTIYNKTNSSNTSEMGKHHVTGGLEIDENKRNTTKLLYQFRKSEDDFVKHTDQTIDKKGSSFVDRDIDVQTDDKVSQHVVSLSHVKRFRGHAKINLSADYAFNENRYATAIVEQSEGGQFHTHNDNRDEFNVLTLKGNLETVLWSNTDLDMGFKVGKVKNIGASSSVHVESGKENYRNDQKMVDQINAGYLSLSNQAGKWQYQLGIRAEQTITNTSLNGVDIIDSTYLNWFPSLSLTYEASSSVSLSIDYNHKIERPYFSDLNPTKVYFDSLSYSEGNPYLRPTIKKNLVFDVSLPHGWSFSAEYTRYDDLVTDASMSDPNNPDIIKYMPINIDHSERWLLGMNKSYSGKVYSYNIGGGVVFPKIDIPYRGEVMKMRDANWFASFSNDLNVTKHWVLFASVNYRSERFRSITTYSDQLNLRAGSTVKMFHNNLYLTVDFSDILDTNDNSWDSQYGYIQSGGVNDFDNRMLRVSLQYNFKDFKELFGTESNNTEDLDRL